MGRNYFSKHGGPYFINDGFSHHKETSSQEDIKPDPKLFYGLCVAFISLIVIIGLSLVVLH
jgi:hypothetical protein